MKNLFCFPVGGGGGVQDQQTTAQKGKGKNEKGLHKKRADSETRKNRN